MKTISGTLSFPTFAILVAVVAPRFVLLVAADCFTSTQDMLIAQIAGGTRELVICPDTTIDIGLPTDATFSSFEDGDVPLSAIADDVTIKCGDNGSSKNNCILNGGFIQFGTTPSIAQAPGLAITTNNLKIQGLTFTGQLADLDVAGEAAVGISAPGTNIILEDVIFEDLISNTILFTSRNALTPVDAFPPMSANVTISNSVFRNITYTRAVVSNVNQTITMDNVLFEDITHLPCEECPGAIASIVYGRDGFTQVIDCEFNNVEFTHSAVFIRGDASGFSYSGNIGTELSIANNEINDEKTCSDGLIISSSPFGSSLNLTEELDSCTSLLDAAAMNKRSGAVSLYGLGVASITFIASMLTLALWL